MSKQFPIFSAEEDDGDVDDGQFLVKYIYLLFYTPLFINAAVYNNAL